MIKKLVLCTIVLGSFGLSITANATTFLNMVVI